MERTSAVYRRKNNWPKTLSCGTSDTSLTSLLGQQSTITCCDQFERNSGQHKDNTEPLIPTEQSLWRISWSLTLSKAALKLSWTILNLMPTLLRTLQCMGHAEKRITGTQTFPISKVGSWKHTTASINRARRTVARHSSTIDYIGVKEIWR